MDQLTNNPWKGTVILYQSAPRFGHWTCVFQLPNGEYEFFDSYGNKADTQQKFVSKRMNDELDQTKKYLSKLLLETGHDRFHYNDEPLQEMSPGINTCGRWVCVRLVFNDMEIDDFIELMENIREQLGPSEATLDDVVVALTQPMLQGH